MNYWLMSDTHFGHNKLIDYCGRSFDFENLILKKMKNAISANDVVIHLGDFCFIDEEYWHTRYLQGPPHVRNWLILGNHDKKTLSWYLNIGWDFVATTMQMDIFGKKILFSHKPQIDTGYDLNFHGHFHNSDHRRHEPELKAIANPKHRLIMMEHHYEPQSLRSLVECSRLSTSKEI